MSGGRLSERGIKNSVRGESCPGSRCPERDSRRKDLGVVPVYRLRKTQPIKIVSQSLIVLYSRANSEADVKE